MALVDATDHHHAHQHLQLGDVARITREQGFKRERPVRRHDEIDPGTGNVDPRQFIDHFIHLREHDAMTERRRFDDGGRVLGIRAGVEVAEAIGLLRADQRHFRRQVHEHARVQLNVGVDRADLKFAVFQQLRHTQALRPGV